MASQTPRLHLPIPDLVDIADGPDAFSDLALALDSAVIYGLGTLAARPTSTAGSPGIPGRIYVVTDTTPKRVDIDLGTSWLTIGAIVPGSVGTTELADRSVTTIKIALGAVTSDELAAASVGTTNIIDLSVNAAKIATSLKPSQGAGAAVEALRALGTAAGMAAAGKHASQHSILGADPLVLSDFNLIGPRDNLPDPSLTPAGTFFWTTDQHTLYFCTGSSWQRMGDECGDMKMTMNAAAMPGRILLQGQAWPVATPITQGPYRDLYQLWGGSNLPDLRGRVPVAVSPGGKALVDAIGDNDGRTAANRNISHRHAAATYTSNAFPEGSVAGEYDATPSFTSGDINNLDYPAYYVVNYEAKL